MKLNRKNKLNKSSLFDQHPIFLLLMMTEHLLTADLILILVQLHPSMFVKIDYFTYTRNLQLLQEI